MTAEAFPPEGGDRGTWAEATPAEVRSVLAPESALEFDRQWRAALAGAAESYDLSVVHQCLDAWRRVARVTTAAGGADGYRSHARRRLARPRRRPSELAVGLVA